MEKEEGYTNPFGTKNRAWLIAVPCRKKSVRTLFRGVREVRL